MPSPQALLWLRRDLRLDDHAALFHALKAANQVQPVFVFDSDILADFADPHDRRLSFIANVLCDIDAQLKKKGGRLLILHGSAQKLIPHLSQLLNAPVFAAEDYEPATRARDEAVAAVTDLTLVKDQLIFSPGEIVRDTGEAYKVFTPYANAWRGALTPISTAPYEYDDHHRYADFTATKKTLAAHNIVSLDAGEGAAAMLKHIGYHYQQDTLWPVHYVHQRLNEFIGAKSRAYPDARNIMAEEGTSRLSPYLRFGLISIRACARAAIDAHAAVWLKELIWREFYAMILFHFPESAHMEWNPKYRGVLDWSHNETHFHAWQKGETGYPLVDAAMRQLLQEGWMHNRARMVVASFLTKHLRIDWRKGEAHFGQYLMDYDLASNVGGWQWAASTGTDAQPYFRVFNPTLQSEKFDPEGIYIKRYVPELARAPKDAIHAPWKHPLLVHYTPPIVDHATARLQAINMFKAA